MNSEVTLKPMTREMYHAFFREYQNDPALYLNPADYVSYVYTEEAVDCYIQRQIDRNRLPFAIMVGEKIVGELKFYDIKPGESAFVGIAMKNDAYKGKGYGTQAERKAIDYCFHTLDIPVLYADSVLTIPAASMCWRRPDLHFCGRMRSADTMFAGGEPDETKTEPDFGTDAPIQFGGHGLSRLPSG